MPAELITGLYFILAGCARFIEEAYRGEIQTAKIGGLSFYQWLAIISVIAGILATTFPASRELTSTWSFKWHTLLTSFITVISWAFAMGMDFPYSKLRFSRLTG